MDSGSGSLPCEDRAFEHSVGTTSAPFSIAGGPTWRHYGQVEIKELTKRVAVNCVQDMEMQLNEREASLVDAFRRLPPDTATELSALAERLGELAPNHRID